MVQKQTQSKRFDINRYLHTSKQKSYFIVFVTVGLIVVVFLVGILPAYSAIVNQRRENKKRDEGIQQLEAVVSQYKNFLTLEEEQAAELELFDRLFPVNNNPQEGVMEDILKYVEETNVTMSSIAFSESKRDVPVQVDLGVTNQVVGGTVSISLEGSRESLLKFIQELEKSRRVYNILSTVISRKDILEGEDIFQGQDYSATIQAEYFWTNPILN